MLLDVVAWVPFVLFWPVRCMCAVQAYMLLLTTDRYPPFSLDG